MHNMYNRHKQINTDVVISHGEKVILPSNKGSVLHFICLHQLNVKLQAGSVCANSM